MKKVIGLLFICLAGLFFTSCDFFRSLAGRPTSEQIKSASVKENASSELCCGQQEDEATVKAKKNSEYEMVHRHGRLNVPFAYTHTDSPLKYTPDHKYYIVVGTYRKKPTLDKMLSDARACGYDPVLLEFSNGLISVGLLPCDELGQAIDAYATVKMEKFCPGDACVLIAK